MTADRRLPRVLQRPEQGWSSLLLWLAMLALVGISFANARPLMLEPAGPSLTGSLPLLMVSGGLVGFLLARSGLGVVRAHILGAATAALLLLWSAGSVVLQADPALAPEAAISERVGAVWVRLEQDVQAAFAGETVTPIITYLLLASILWTTAQFGAFSVFRYDRGGPAVAATGTVLFLNVGLGSTVPEDELLPVLPVLAVYSALAMALLIRMQLVQQRLGWARRHIADTGEVRRLFLRSGALFVAITVISASSLTAMATVEPLTVKLDQLEEPIEDLGDQIARWLGLVGVPPPQAAPMPRGDASEIWSSWTPGEGTAFTATPADPIRGNYWWGWADDHYDVDDGEWKRTGWSEMPVTAGAQLPLTVSVGRTYETVVSMVLGDAEPPTARAHLFRLAEASSVLEEDVTALVVDDGRHASDILWRAPLDEGDEVSVTSYVHDYRVGGEGVTANQLRAASTDYPAWVTDKYLRGAGDERINGPGIQALVAEITESHANVYDQALALQDEFLGGDYAYVVEVDCSAHDSIPECVMAEQRGFCAHYATTMALALREMGIPSRFVTGYLPGERDLDSGTWTVEQAALHNWVEAYFPDYGWIRFDPTPGRGYGQAPTALDDGEVLSPGELPTFPREAEPTGLVEPTPEPSEEAFVAPTPDSGSSDTIYLVISVGGIVALLLTVVGVLLLFRLRRLPGGDEGLAYRGIVSLATRLGYGPHPSQTEYEYAGTLSEAVPGVRDDLYVVADARVETAYGQRHLDRDRRGRLRGAYTRIRTALLRLSLRRR